VDDRSTSLLMWRFYENWLGGMRPMSKAAALQEAKRWLRTWTDAEGTRPYAHPYFWAGFVLIGDRG
jgi:CHAT domain-containing protein